MNNEKIKRIITDILDRMAVSYDKIDILESGMGGCPRFVIRSSESGLLIGQRGETLLALNHLIKRIVSKGTEEEGTNFFLDINDYQDRLIQEIKNKALILKERAKLFQRDVEMEPGSAYERMIVHSACADDPEINTESSGEGRSRRVVIKYKNREESTVSGGEDISTI